MMEKKLLVIAVTIMCFGIGVTHGKILDTLKIEGLVHTREAVVRNTIPLRSGASFASTDVQEAIRTLFAMGAFRSVDFYITEESETNASLLLKVEEYPLCLSIEFHGNRRLKTDELEEDLGLVPNQVASDALLHKTVSNIRDKYIEEGHRLVEIDVELVDAKIPGTAIAKYTIDEGPRVRISEISFKGNSHISDSRLSREFNTKERTWWLFRRGYFDETLYRSHLDSLVMFYNEQGYLDAAIENDSIWYSESQEEIFIEITIDEGDRYYTGDIFFTGNSVLDDETLASRVAMRKGRHFEASRFEMTKALIEDAYREEGHLWVRIDDKPTFRGDTIDVVMNIHEGRPAIVRRIDIQGNDKTMEKVIRRELELVPGQRYRQSQMVRSHQNLHRLGYFENIMPDLKPNEDGTIDLIFHIAEKDNIGQLTIGAAYSQTDNFTGTFSTAIPNFRGAGQELKVDLQAGSRRRTVNLGFTDPWAFDTPWWLTGTVFYDRSIFDRIERDADLEEATRRDTATSIGFRTGVGRSRMSWPDDKFRVNAIYQLSREETNYKTDTVPELGLQIMESGTLSRLTFNIERYDFDMPLFPNSGSRLRIRPEIAGIGGDYSYLKGTFDYEHYFQLPWNLVLGSETRMGLIHNLGRDIKISRLDLFSAGGVYSDGTIRGYPDFEFGGRYRDNGDGIAMLTSSLQLRYPLVDQQVYLALFADVGNTWSRISDMSLNDLYKGVGFGLRVNVPMLGIMGFDFAWGLDDTSRDTFREEPSGFQLHFIMNQGF
ncbi:outer membrane protein assembly factor BamA [Chitinispirillales bacterium ANBcel5]|uniref:outer membrane protein assembly factor BamA n=1 Tax=Cellulosispirillum alkaliphilum TaxID=3039283 RepID=UPI002A560CEE|nr:outer membrane protein assembly factor BamA [Chitinispirillales bacterium ANBcel5]